MIQKFVNILRETTTFFGVNEHFVCNIIIIIFFLLNYLKL